MLDTPKSVKKPTNLSLNPEVLAAAKALGMNISQTVDALLAAEVKRRHWELWNARNQAAVSACNERVAEYGLPLAKYRSFGQRLGDRNGDA